MAEQSEHSKTLDEAGLSLTDLAVWPQEAVLLLLEKFRNKRHLLKIPSIRKMDVWQLIAREINEEGYCFTPQACFKKWDNMRNRYKIITERHKTKGIAGTKWAYLGVMADILQDEASTTGPVISSSLSGAKVFPVNKTEESGEDSDPSGPMTSWSFQEVGSFRTESTPCRGKKRKREDPPPVWLKEFLEKTTHALDRLCEAVAERNVLLKQLVEKL